MFNILNKKFLLTIIIASSCNQDVEPVNEITIPDEPIVDLKIISPIVIDNNIQEESSLNQWTEFKLIESSILDLSNSVDKFINDDINLIEDILNKLSDNSRGILKSDIELYTDNPEIKGRLKLLNIQIQKTKQNLNNLKKNDAVEELNKIIVFYNYSANMIESKISNLIN